jgi:PTH1 family peptidyl-tRNA hydrolase
VVKLVVGLGNPGKEYEGTRHNVGFDIVDSLARAHQIRLDQRAAGLRALFGRGHIAGQPVVLAKPQTYMNNSGEAVGALLRREEAGLTDLIVVCDDIHIPVGRLRIRARGSSGGQNGLKSVAALLGSQDWARMRIGVGEPPPGLQIDWVLSRFGGADRKQIDDVLIVAMGAVEVWLADGVETAMNRFNGDAGAV